MNSHFSTEIIQSLELESLAPATKSHFWLDVASNKIGQKIRLPIIVAKGRKEGPTLGITAALHGNELNGIPIIQRLIGEVNLEDLAGTIVGVLVVNVPGLLLEQRNFNDGVDLNHCFPGNPNGNLSSLFANRLVDLILGKLDYLIDLHTASFGRVNSFYVRADMSCETTARMARLQNPQIIVDNPPNDRTMRGTAVALGTKAITLELQDPHLFQYDVIDGALVGVWNVLSDLKMITEREILCPAKKTILCSGSYWMFTDVGGILEVVPEVTKLVEKGATIAVVRSIFGEVLKEYAMPEEGVIVGRSVNPLNQTGSRIVHIGKNPQEIDCIIEE